jgi:ribose transport system permease protein
VVATTIVMRRSVFGRHVYAIGSNEAAARLCGIRVQWTKVAVYATSGAFTGLAGALTTSKLHQGDPTIAAGAELDVIAAVVLGGASLSGGSGAPVGAVIGALLMGVLRSGSQQLGWSSSTQLIIVGSVIILAAGIDRLRQRRS